MIRLGKKSFKARSRTMTAHDRLIETLAQVAVSDEVDRKLLLGLPVAGMEPAKTRNPTSRPRAAKKQR